MATKVVRGKRLRATRVDRCGMPLAGPKAQITTKGFITVTFSNQYKDAEDLTQTNADGDECVNDRTTPELRFTNVTVNLCDVDTELFTMMSGLPQVLDWDDNPTGFRQNKQINVEEGYAIEVWSGTAGDDCEEPLDDSFLTRTAASRKYGYWLAPAIIESTLQDIEIGASVSTFTLAGRTPNGGAPAWGRGPYDVVAQDAQNTPGRLLTPWKKNEHWQMDTVTVEPPAVVSGAQPLVLPTPYYGAVAGG